MVDNDILTSFYLWFDNKLMSKGAFKNTESKLSFVSGSHFEYKSPYGQWVYDSSIYKVTGELSGVAYAQRATVNSGAKIGVNFIPKSGNGAYTNYQIGSVVLPPPSGAYNSNVTAKYAYKTFNLYTSDDTESKILFQTKYIENPTSNPKDIPNIIERNSDRIFPCAIIKYNVGPNSPLELGGVEWTKPKIRVICIADNLFNSNFINGLFRDTQNSPFYLLDGEDFPFNTVNDLKFGGYNYPAIVNDIEKNDANHLARMVYIRRVSVSKYTEKFASDLARNAIPSIIDFELEIMRVPRSKPEYTSIQFD